MIDSLAMRSLRNSARQCNHPAHISELNLLLEQMLNVLIKSVLFLQLDMNLALYSLRQPWEDISQLWWETGPGEVNLLPLLFRIGRHQFSVLLQSEVDPTVRLRVTSVSQTPEPLGCWCAPFKYWCKCKKAGKIESCLSQVDWFVVSQKKKPLRLSTQRKKICLCRGRNDDPKREADESRLWQLFPQRLSSARARTQQPGPSATRLR